MVILFKPAEIPYVGVVTVFWRFYENEWGVIEIKGMEGNKNSVPKSPK